MTNRRLSHLETPRCSLRPVQPSDLEALHALWTRPEVRRFLWDDELIPLSQTRDLVADSSAHFEAGDYGLWLARLRDRTDVIGFTGYWPFHEPVRVELLFGLAGDHWGLGYATEIATAMVSYGRDHLSMETVLASTDEPNRASVAVLDRLGFRQSHQDPETGTLFFEKVLRNGALG